MNQSLVSRLLPSPITNTFTGSSIALYAFWVITVTTIIRSLIHIFAPDGGAQSIATIPLEFYPTAAASAVVFVFALWGLSQLLMGVVYAVVVWRYRSLIPAMYVLLFVEYFGRLLLGWLKPIETTGTAPGGWANYILVPLLLVLYVLSVRSSNDSTT